MLLHLHWHGTMYRTAQATTRQQLCLHIVVCDFKDVLAQLDM